MFRVYTGMSSRWRPSGLVQILQAPSPGSTMEAVIWPWEMYIIYTLCINDVGIWLSRYYIAMVTWYVRRDVMYVSMNSTMISAGNNLIDWLYVGLFPLLNTIKVTKCIWFCLWSHEFDFMQRDGIGTILTVWLCKNRCYFLSEMTFIW